MNTIQFGLRSYRNVEQNHESVNRSAHPLDILSDILFDIRSENRQRESAPRKNSERQPEEFRDVLSREMGREMERIGK